MKVIRLLNFAIAYSTPYLVNTGPGYAGLESRVFFLWGSFCFVCIAFVIFFIYEVCPAIQSLDNGNLLTRSNQTKGLSLEQVDELYGIVSKAWKSKEFRPQVSFQDVEEMDKSGGRKLSMAEMADATQRKRSMGSTTENHEKV